jgi:cobalt-zinc-cadmium efflux system membrane fusion protein
MLIHPVILIALLALLNAGCRDPKPAPSAPPPAKVENPVKESDLTAIKLTPEAETRVGIKVTAVTSRQVTDTRTVAGEVIVPPGLSLDVAAPVAGTLAASAAGPVEAGQRVRRGQALFRIIPLLPAERDLRINAERDVEAAAATVEATRRKVARAEQLLADGSGSRRALEEARAELGNAEAAVKAAQERLSVVNRSPINQANELVVSAPSDGVVETVSAAPGQAVAASAPLVRIARIDRLWIKVPIYAGDRRALDLQRGADVLRLDDPHDAPGVRARPVAAPPTANPNASAVDAVFELTGPGDLMPGERVLVRLSGRGGSHAIVIPESALLHDIHGGVWVYEQTAPNVFARRRVEVRDTTAGLAVLAQGPKPGDLVVTTGAAVLYGVEFGPGK